MKKQIKKSFEKMHPLERIIIRLENEIKKIKVSPAEEGEMEDEKYRNYLKNIDLLEDEIQRVKSFLV
jgi:hypothetical protein